LATEADVFDVIRRQDVLLHHPYESFQSVVDFLQKAAQDPKVLAIKITLYRTSGDSPIVRALMNAVANGKQVTVLVELRARFDEANNINWARQMEEAGIHVVYGVVGLKVHCKLLLVVRRDEDQIRQYVHLSTGNYHPSTARLYTDLGLLTANAEIGQEVANLFNALTGLSNMPETKKLMVSPFNMRDQLVALIRRERDLAKSGREGRIIIKCNGLVDEEVICALYEASGAGAQIDLIVRGICCLRPKLPGVSENIRVISIVGRFLEHSRIFYFGNGGDPKVFLGSADVMPRNLLRRFEVIFPVEDAATKARLCNEILPAYLADKGKARELQADGTYKRLHAPGSVKAPQAQRTFRELAQHAGSVVDTAGDAQAKLIPLRQPPAAAA
jgi:polyphosphate kinase